MKITIENEDKVITIIESSNIDIDLFCDIFLDVCDELGIKNYYQLEHYKN